MTIFEDCPALIAAFDSDINLLKSITKKAELFERKSVLEFENAGNEERRLNVFDFL